MCYFVRTSYRCGHTVQETCFCDNARRHPRTNALLMCERRLHPDCRSYDCVCGHSDCILSTKGGVWVCCKCNFGEFYSGLNRHRFCIGRDCDHEVCSKCEQWKPGT